MLVITNFFRQVIFFSPIRNERSLDIKWFWWAPQKMVTTGKPQCHLLSQSSIVFWWILQVYLTSESASWASGAGWPHVLRGTMESRLKSRAKKGRAEKFNFLRGTNYIESNSVWRERQRTAAVVKFYVCEYSILMLIHIPNVLKSDLGQFWGLFSVRARHCVTAIVLRQARTFDNA